jgi:hypothetical protein
MATGLHNCCLIVRLVGKQAFIADCLALPGAVLGMLPSLPSGPRAPFCDPGLGVVIVKTSPIGD